jgi:hypothetical protein
VAGALKEAERKGANDLATAAVLAGWATPTKGDAQKVTPFHDAPQPALAYQCQLLAGWPTPMAGSPGTEEYNPAGNTDSSRKTVALLAGWATPTTNAKDQPSNTERGLETLAGQAGLLAGWNTPRATDGSKGGPNQTGGALPADASLCGTTGATPLASTVETGSGGAFRLNPAFSAWLMGFPPIWDEVGCRVQPATRSRAKAPTAPPGSAGTATRSASKRRRRSSGRSSKQKPSSETKGA